MSVRSRIADPPAGVVAKTFGTAVPDSFRQGEIASQMTPASPFSPGQPIGPYDGYDRHPWTFNRQTAYNIATRPRTNEAVSFSTLTGLVESYDIAQLVIWHRIDSIRSLDYKLVPAGHYDGDVTDAVPVGLAALRKPDRRNSFKTWLARFLFDVLAWDAGTLYRLRNRAGRCIGLQPVDGRTIAPLLDYWGNSPAAASPGDPEPEAFVQYVNGLPWNWLTRSDLIYEPFRPVTGSPYGRPPIESVILNANTDLRTQVYYLQYFTEGNLPAAFAASPESWSPDQIEQFQTYWDAMMYGDQSRKHQIRWMPPGSKFEWSNEREFSDAFSMYLLQKTCAAYHVVPSDLGLTQDINRSSGESQADVQHRVGDLPLMEYIEGILSQFLQDDLGLPLEFQWDRGEEQVDQYAQAQADVAYMDRAVISGSEIREMRYGLTDAKPVPRVFFTERAGPIPLNSLLAVAGPVDPQTAAPEEGAELPHQVFEEAPGVQPNPPLYGQPLAEEIYGPSAIPAGTETASTRPVAKEGEGAAPGPAAGITAETGIYSYDLERGDEDEPDEAAVAKRYMTIEEARAKGREVRERELAVFRRFCRARRKDGNWRDFEFEYHSPSEARELNRAAMVDIAKAAGEVAVAGLAVLAADTGRVLMLQRAICDDDPASGDLEFPGGHVEGGESPLQAAWREWSEETGAVPPPGVQTGEWTSANGIYRGIVWTTEAEASVPVRGGAVVPNPDDPDGDSAEAIMWMDPADLPGNPMVRAELAADLDAVMAALGPPPSPACCGAECCQDGGCCGGTGGCTCAPPAEVVKAGPKVPDREHPGPEPIWGAIEDRRAKLTRSHLKAVLAAWNALAGTLDSRALVRQYRDGTVAKYADPDRNRALDLAAAWLATLALAGGWAAFTSAIGEAIRSAMAEGEADALAVAADRQGVKGFRIGPAYDAAYARLGDDLGIAAQADDAARKMLDGTAAAVSGVLAGSGSEDGEDETPDAVDGTVTGNDVQPVTVRVTDLIWGAIGAGIVWLAGRASSGRGPASAPPVPGAPPAPPPVPPQPPTPVLVNWVTDGNPCPACVSNEAGSPYAPGDVPPFPQHPRCKCELVPVGGIPAAFFLP